MRRRIASPKSCAREVLRRVVSSSSILSVGYDETSRTLEVEFWQGEVYQYFARHLAPSDRMLCVLSVDTEAAKQKALALFGLRQQPAGTAAAAGSSAWVEN